MSKQVLVVPCTVQLDHSDSRLILVPTEEGMAELAKARSARKTLNVPVEFELNDENPMADGMTHSQRMEAGVVVPEPKPE